MPALAAAQGDVGGRRALRGREPAIVGGEHDDGVLLEAQVGELLHDAPDALIEALHHRGIDRLVLNLARLVFPFRQELRPGGGRQPGGLGLIFRDHLGFGLLRVVDGVMREVEQEGLSSGALDELQRLIGQPVREVLAFGAVRQRRNPVRTEVGGRGPSSAAGDVEVEALLLGEVVRARRGAICR